MLKNKFNIGQTVIVVADREVVEKTVVGIKPKKDKLLYELSSTRFGEKENKAPSFAEFHTAFMSAIKIDMDRSFRPSTYPVPQLKREELAYSLENYSTATYKESDIFTNEEEFRASVKIKALPPVPTPAPVED